MEMSFDVSTLGISADLQFANGDPTEIGRGPLDAANLWELLNRVQHLASPAPERDDVCIPQVLVHGPAGRFLLYCDGGHLFSYEVDAALDATEAMQFVTGQRPLPSAAPPPPPPSGGASFFRGLVGLVVALVLLVFGIGGGVAIIRNTDEQVYQIAGIFIMIASLMFASGVYRAIRGRTRGQANAERLAHQARQQAMRAEQATLPRPAGGQMHNPALAPVPGVAVPAVQGQAMQGQAMQGQAPTPEPTSVPGRVSLALAFESGSLAGQTITMAQPHLRIGRADDNEIRFDAHRDIAVSGHHAELRTLPNGLLQLRDVGSSGGTYVNGARVGNTILCAGQLVTFGDNGPSARVVQSTPAPTGVPKTIVRA